MGLLARLPWGVLAASLLWASPAWAQSASDEESEASQPGAAAGGGARRDDDSQEQEEDSSQNACGAGSMALTTGGCTKRWRVIGLSEYRQQVVRDDTPSNDYLVRAWAQGSYRLTLKHNVQAWARIGFTQRFVAEEGERGARFNDVVLGADYLHSVPLEGWSGRALSFQHRMFLNTPTSRDSQNQNMYLALTALERVRLNPLPYLFTGVDLSVGYRFHKYAERAGRDGTPLPRATFDGRAVVEVYPFQGKPYGSLLLGVDAGLGYTRTYEGRGADPTTSGDSTTWNQRFNWDAYLYYLPTSYLWVGLSLEQGAPVIRNGANQVAFVDRNDTQLAMSVIGVY